MPSRPRQARISKGDEKHSDYEEVDKDDYADWLEEDRTGRSKVEGFISRHDIQVIPKEQLMARLFNPLWLVPLLLTCLWGAAEFIFHRRRTRPD